MKLYDCYKLLGWKVGTETSFSKIIKDNSCLFNLIYTILTKAYMWSEVVL